MRATRFILAVCFVLAVANCPAVPAQGGAENSEGSVAVSGPLAEVPEKLFDFGELKDGVEYVHSFVVKNIGTAPLEIKKVIKI